MSLPPDVSRSASVAEPAAQPAPTSRRRWLYGAVAGAAALGGAGLAWWRFQPHAMQDGAEAALWSMEFDTPTGGAPLAMKALQGRPVLLNFWATWCPPCVEELPMLNAFYRENASKGWQVVGLAIDSLRRCASFWTGCRWTFLWGWRAWVARSWAGLWVTSPAACLSPWCWGRGAGCCIVKWGK